MNTAGVINALQNYVDIICKTAVCYTALRFVLAFISAYLAFPLFFFGIKSKDDLIKHIEQIQLPIGMSNIRIMKYLNQYRRLYAAITALGSAAILAIQYPSPSYIAIASAIFYGLLGPWAVREQIAKIMREKAVTTVSEGITQFTENSKKEIKEEVIDYLSRGIKEMTEQKGTKL